MLGSTACSARSRVGAEALLRHLRCALPREADQQMRDGLVTERE